MHPNEQAQRDNGQPARRAGVCYLPSVVAATSPPPASPQKGQRAAGQPPPFAGRSPLRSARPPPVVAPPAQPTRKAVRCYCPPDPPKGDCRPAANAQSPPAKPQPQPPKASPQSPPTANAQPPPPFGHPRAPTTPPPAKPPHKATRCQPARQRRGGAHEPLGLYAGGGGFRPSRSVHRSVNFSVIFLYIFFLFLFVFRYLCCRSAGFRLLHLWQVFLTVLFPSQGFA